MAVETLTAADDLRTLLSVNPWMDPRLGCVVSRREKVQLASGWTDDQLGIAVC